MSEAKKNTNSGNCCGALTAGQSHGAPMRGLVASASICVIERESGVSQSGLRRRSMISLIFLTAKKTSKVSCLQKDIL